MRLGFLVEGLGYYKLYGSLIEEALRRGAEVHLFHRRLPSDLNDPKGYGWADTAQVPMFINGTPKVWVWETEQALLEMCVRQCIETMVSVWLYPRAYGICRALKARGVRWIALQHATEVFKMDAAALALPDVTCMFTPFWVERALAVFGEQVSIVEEGGKRLEVGLRKRLAVTGAPELDAIHGLDALAIRRAYGVPEGRPVVVWLPHDYHQHDHWEMLVFRRNWHPKRVGRAVLDRRWDIFPRIPGGATHAQLMRAMREFCDRNGAFFIVKSRIKDRPAEIDRRAADLFTFDRCFYPATILEVLRIADLCIHVLSAATLEAAALGVPSLCLEPPPYSEYMLRPTSAFLAAAPDFPAPGTVWNYPGVTRLMPIEEATRKLTDLRLDDFTLVPKLAAQYLEKYVGPIDGQNARRVWEVITAV